MRTSECVDINRFATMILLEGAKNKNLALQPLNG